MYNTRCYNLRQNLIEKYNKILSNVKRFSATNSASQSATKIATKIAQ